MTEYRLYRDSTRSKGVFRRLLERDDAPFHCGLGGRERHG